MSAKSTSDLHASNADRDDPYLISPEEAWRIFDTRARKLLGMSGEEFVRKIKSGEIVDDDTDWAVTAMAMMITPDIEHRR